MSNRRKGNGSKRFSGRPAACLEVPGEEGCIAVFRSGKGMCFLCTTPRMLKRIEALKNKKIKKRGDVRAVT